MSSATTGTRQLLHVTLRHDFRKFAPWIAIVTALAASSALIYPWVFPTVEERLALSTAISSNPALGLIFGPVPDISTVDGFTAWRGLALGGLLIGIGAIFTVVRASRGQEDSGQAELLASGVLGRSSRLLTAVLMACIGSVLAGLVAGVVTALCGASWSVAMLLGATFTATGWISASLAAVAAQIGTDARTASSLAVGTLGTLFLLCGFSYSIDAPSWTIWANPLGWMHETAPSSTGTWWPLLLAVGFSVIVLGIAFMLQSRRDFGQGTIAPRPGPARGGIHSTIGLAFRLNRGQLISWSIAFVALGVVFGYMSTSVQDLLSARSGINQVLASGATSSDELVSSFLVTILSLAGIIASVAGIQAIVKVRSEELNERVEPIIATATTRPHYLGANVLVAFTTVSLALLIGGTIIAAIAASADIGVRFGDALLQAVATIPAVWTVVAFSVFIIGARPKVSIAAWAGVLLSFGITILGPSFKLPDWAMAISPYWHIPAVGTSGADWMGLVWISLVTIAFLAIGIAGFRRRDLALS